MVVLKEVISLTLKLIVGLKLKIDLNPIQQLKINRIHLTLLKTFPNILIHKINQLASPTLISNLKRITMIMMTRINM